MFRIKQLSKVDHFEKKVYEIYAKKKFRWRKTKNRVIKILFLFTSKDKNLDQNNDIISLMGKTEGLKYEPKKN